MCKANEREQRERKKERERERERYIRIEKEKKRKDDDERIFLRLFSVFACAFSSVGDDSEEENDADDLYHEEAKCDFKKRFGEFRRRWEERRILRRTRQVD